MGDLVFLRPIWLVGVAASIVAMVYLYRSKKSIKSDWWGLMDSHIARALVVSSGSHKFMMPLNILLVVIAAVCLAMAGPSLDRQVPDELKGKASIVVLLANSDSMYAGDITPNRNRVAKLKIEALTQHLEGSQFGLIAYAKSAHQVSPLTSDPKFLSLYLDELEPKLMPTLDFKESGLDDALSRANKMLMHARYPGNLLVITDQMSTDNVASIISFNNNEEVDIEVLAVGTEKGGSLRFVEDKDLSGEADTQLDLVNFSELKEQGIAMIGVTQNEGDIEWVTEQIKKSVKNTNDRNPDFQWRDSGYLLAWLFIPACLLLFRKQSWLFGLLPVLFVAGITYSPASSALTWDEIWWSGDQLGQKAVEQGNYEQAVSYFDDPFMKAWSLYQLADYENAETLFRQVETANGYFYLANSLAMQEKFKQALEVYGKAIKLGGDSKAIEINVTRVMAKMASSNKVSANERTVEDQGQIILQVGARGNVKKKQHLNIDPLIYSDEELNVWLNKVKSSPENLLKTKFELQAQEKMLDEL
jgi:Ca-activated chloride channel family protein